MDNWTKPLEVAEILLARWAEEVTRPEPNRLDIAIKREVVLEAVRVLHGTEWGYLAAITGVDLGAEAGEMEVLYHFCSGAAIVTLRVRVPRERAEVPTVCPVIPSATFFERELSEMLGITVTGTPDTARLFLPDEWPAGVYPLRKE